MDFKPYKKVDQIRYLLNEIDEFSEFMKMCVCFLGKNEAFNEDERTAIKNAYKAVAESLKRNLDFVFARSLGILGKPFNGVSLANSQSLSQDQEDDLRNNAEDCKDQ